MYARGNEFRCRFAILMAIVLLLTPMAWSQWDSRPAGRLAPFTSGPAAVSLVATLESLSVSATPAALPVSASASRVAPSLTLTTAWTLRADCTTLRLSGSSGAFTAFGRDPLSVSSRDNPDRLVLHASAAVPANNTGWSGVAQPVGATSRPGTRTDNVELSIDRQDHPGSAAQPSPIYILAQAL
jgi:hypothetical protein